MSGLEYIARMHPERAVSFQLNDFDYRRIGSQAKATVKGRHCGKL
jgi:hypothetical protein